MEHHYWFSAKEYGWGWYPASWEGWVVLSAFLVVIVAWSVISPPRQSVSKYLLGVGVCAAALIVVAWATGEPPEWRWGSKT